MIISINGAINKYDVPEDLYLKKIKEIGFDGFDYSLHLGWRKINPVFNENRNVWLNYFKDVKKKLNDNGLETLQTHATYPTNIDGEDFLSDKCLDHFKKEIEATKLLDSKYIVIHPINHANLHVKKEFDYEVNMDMYRKFDDTLKEFDVYACVENMWQTDNLRKRLCDTGCSSPQDMIKYVDGIGSDRFVACLDTGHMHDLSYSPAEAVRLLGNRLKVLHVNDNFGITDDHTPIGIGSIDWEDFALALKETNYDGAFSMELNANRALKYGIDVFFAFHEYAFKSAKALVEKIEK